MFCPYPKSLATCINFDMVGIPKPLSGSNYTKGDKKRMGAYPPHNHGSPNNDPISQGRESCEETQFPLVVIVVRGSTTAPKNHWTRSTQFKGCFAYLYMHILELMNLHLFPKGCAQKVKTSNWVMEKRKLLLSITLVGSCWLIGILIMLY